MARPFWQSDDEIAFSHTHLDEGEKQKNVWDDDDDERRSHARVTVEDSFVIL
jgi:hypothetical protein|tara:strand:+ start:228 stop:383 length:156 start_codon:yes stop_codon:yes gene_type:complete